MRPEPPPPRLAAAAPAGERDGRSPVERLAVARLADDAAALHASEIVQLVLWPQTLAAWAREADVAGAVAYNMLARFKPYRRVRELLAHRLDVPAFVLDHLIDAPRPLPMSQRAPRAPTDEPHERPAPAPPPDVVEPTVRLPSVRDGSNPLERRAVWRVWRDVAALPASVLVQLALFPQTLAEWAREHAMPASIVYATLAGSAAHPPVRYALARRLGVSTLALDQVIDSPRREPEGAAATPLPTPPLAEPPAGRERTADTFEAPPGDAARGGASRGEADPQLGLGL